VASVYRIITNNLKMRKVTARCVPHYLSDEQKACRQRIAEELLKRYQTVGRSPPHFDSFPKLKMLPLKCPEWSDSSTVKVFYPEYRICQNVGKLS
jgi:hypothetical protein